VGTDSQERRSSVSRSSSTWLKFSPFVLIALWMNDMTCSPQSEAFLCVAAGRISSSKSTFHEAKVCSSSAFFVVVNAVNITISINTTKYKIKYLFQLNPSKDIVLNGNRVQRVQNVRLSSVPVEIYTERCLCLTIVRCTRMFTWHSTASLQQNRSPRFAARNTYQCRCE
jgi:hypothetical protein